MTTHEGAPNMPTHPEVVTLDPSDPARLALALKEAAGSTGFTIRSSSGRAIDDGADFTAAFAVAVLQHLAEPVPEEPPEWSVVRANHVTLVRMDPGSILRPRDYRWWRIGTEETARTWPEVCALGTPEVLEPEAVKALREQVAQEDGDADRLAPLDARLFRLAVTDPSEGVEHAFDVIRDRTESLLEEVRHLRERDAAAEDEPAEPAPVEVTKEPTDPNVVVRDNAGTAWERRRARTMPEFFYWYDGQRAWDTSDGHSWDGLLKRYGPLTLVETGGQS